MASQNRKTDRSRRQAIARAKSDLTTFPKDPAEDVQVPLMVQLKFGWLVSLIFPLLTVICYMGSLYAINTDRWFHAMCCLLAVSAIVFLFLIILSIWTLTLSSRMRHLASGNYYVLWKIPDQEWQSQCQETTLSLTSVSFWAILITMGTGMTAAGQAYADRKLFFETTLSHFVGSAALSLIIGLVLGLFFWKLLSLKTEFMSSRSGRILIGPCGIYRTGSFWSFDGTFQQLYDVTITEEEQQQLHLKVGTSGRYGINYELIEIAIPEGEMLNAKLLRRELQRKYSLSST